MTKYHFFVGGAIQVLGESFPVVKVSCGTPVTRGRCLGNPQKRARTVHFKRTSDFELSASKIAVTRQEREERGDQRRGAITFGLTCPVSCPVPSSLALLRYSRHYSSSSWSHHCMQPITRYTSSYVALITMYPMILLYYNCTSSVDHVFTIIVSAIRQCAACVNSKKVTNIK